MRYTQFCIFEITDKCNRGREHWQCPNANPERWVNNTSNVPMTDEQIVSVAEAMYAGGFTGMVAFHHYCEPLAAWDRLKRVIAQIRERVPQSRFLLWTNGDYFASIPKEEIDGVFCKMMVTDYAGRGLEYPRSICPEVHEIPVNLDWRVKPPKTAPTREPHCIRPFLEIVFDYYGHVRVCCMDWKREVQLGNIHSTPFEDLWQRWVRLREELASTPMEPDAPYRCRTCGTRYLYLADYVPEITARTLEYLGGKS